MRVTVCDVCGERIKDEDIWKLDVRIYNYEDNVDATNELVEMCPKCAHNLQQVLQGEYGVEFELDIQKGEEII